jgi:A/G-specific adenine glycosylase
MLQQTRVDTVVPYYERFLERFPTVDALAAADEQDVLREWSGLGYYARARNLWRAAGMVVRDHGGELPRDPEALTALPGIGAYTAGAVRSIAFGERAAIVDGNVRRVLSRLRGEPALENRELWALAGDLVPERAPDEFNQALMELGALVCTPRAPTCETCPIAGDCRGHASGNPEAFPVAAARPAPKAVRALAGVLERKRPRAVLMMRRPSSGLLGGLWELPSTEGVDPDRLLADLRERTGLVAEPVEKLGHVQHAFSHRALRLTVLRLAPLRGRLKRDASARWCARRDLEQLPLSVLTRKTLRLAGLL